jgi:Tfp pilus assembly protein PilF
MSTLPIAACLIVRDESALLPRCLGSVAGLVQEIIVADTGSTDASRDVARAFGARVLDVAWHDDFAAARNAVLDAVTAPWVLMLDADEWLPDQTVSVLAQVLPQVPGDAVIYGNRLALDHGVSAFGILLWPGGAGLRYRGRVHEVLDFPQPPAVAEAPDLVVLNQRPGWSEADRQRRTVFYERLLQADLAGDPWPETLLAAGDIALDRRDPAKSMAYYQQAIAHPDSEGHLRALVQLQMCAALRLAGDFDQADRLLEDVVLAWPEYLDARIEAAERAQASDEPEKALWAWSTALRLVRFDRPQFLARRDARPGRLLDGISRALARLGDVAGEAACQAAVIVSDGDAELLQELSRRLDSNFVLAWQWYVLIFARPEVTCSDRLRPDDPVDVALVFAELAAFLQRRRGVGPDAEPVLRDAVRRHPGDPRVLGALARLLAGYRHWDEAWSLIEQACQLAPDSGEWQWQRGMIARVLHRPEEARQALALAAADPVHAVAAQRQLEVWAAQDAAGQDAASLRQGL